jgi:hypothetical protein
VSAGKGVRMVESKGVNMEIGPGRTAHDDAAAL